MSVDGGTNFSEEIQIDGNSNAQWTYTGGNYIQQNVYDGDNTPVTYSPAGGGNRDDDNDGPQQVEVLDVPAGDLVFRITLENNSSNEYWAVDNLTINV